MAFGCYQKPKNDARYEWTNHVVSKMRYYGLSEGRVRRVVRAPKRTEEGIAPGTIAVMQPGGGKRKDEIWVMYQLVRGQRIGDRGQEMQKKRKIITAWRYP